MSINENKQNAIRILMYCTYLRHIGDNRYRYMVFDNINMVCMEDRFSKDQLNEKN